MKNKKRQVDYGEYLYIKSIYPKWKELDNFDADRIHAIYKSLMQREIKRKEKLKEEKKYHQMTLWEVGLK